jgi:hypothetical protein
MYLYEGGNAIANAEPVNPEDVPAVVQRAKLELPQQLLKNLQADIGSAGYKTVPAGDIDLMLEAQDLVALFQTEDNPKDPVLAAKQSLATYLQAKQLDANVKGRNVHCGIPYKQQATGKNKIAQVDYMVVNDADIVAPYHQHGPRGMYSDPSFKGQQNFVLMASIAKYLGLKFDPFGASLVRRDNNEVVARKRADVARVLLGPTAKESDLDSVKTIMTALKNDPDREGKLAQARDDQAKGLLTLPEDAAPGTAAWFRQLGHIV